MKYEDFCTEYCPMTRDLAGQWVVGVSDTCRDKVKCEGWRRYSTVQYSTVVQRRYEPDRDRKLYLAVLETKGEFPDIITVLSLSLW